MPDQQPHSWTRVRPRRTTIDPGVGLAAEVADPLWFLCRQLQMAEFTGDGGGTPTSLTISATWTPFTHWRPGARKSTTRWLPYDRDRPLEALVEDDRMTVGEAPPLLATVEAGQRLVRRLRAALPALASHEALPRVVEPARPSAVATQVHARRTVDGFRLRAHLATVRQTLESGLGTGDKTTLGAVLDEWIEWFDRRFGNPTHDSSWIQNRLEHQFLLAAPDPDGGDPLVFSAPEYLGGGIDWSDLELVDDVEPPQGMPADRVRTFEQTHKYPQPLRWRGMPVDRFWQLEDGSVDLGELTVDPADLPGLLALDMAATGSTDWFLSELPLPAAGVARIDKIVVTDTFGRPTTVTPGDAEASPDIGLLFAPVGSGRAGAGWLVMAPRLGARVDGPEREEIMLVRDELANLGWIIERTGPTEDGEPGELRSRPRPDQEPSPDGSLAYQLGTAAPEHWLPLLPVRRGGGRLELARGTVWSEAEQALPTTMLARHIDSVLDEEVPREGKRLLRSWQYARWFDGSRHLWSGRTVEAGRGEANSALRFDDTH